MDVGVEVDNAAEFDLLEVDEVGEEVSSVVESDTGSKDVSSELEDSDVEASGGGSVLVAVTIPVLGTSVGGGGAMLGGNADEKAFPPGWT